VKLIDLDLVYYSSTAQQVKHVKRVPGK